MGKRPSNILLYVVLSIIALLGLYIFGNLILETQDDDAIEYDENLNNEELNNEALNNHYDITTTSW